MEMKNIALAIIEVMKAVKGMEKNSSVGSGNYGYKGTKDQDVKEVFNDALSNAGLCIVPTSIQSKTKVDRWMDGTRSKQSVFTEVETTYLLIHDSGESIELAGYGQGVDTQDKEAGKATTYALKNCLLYTFLTPVGKIDDTDTTHSDDIETPKKVETKVVAPFPKKEKRIYTGEMAVKGIESNTPLATMMKNFEMDSYQQSDYIKLLDGDNKS